MSGSIGGINGPGFTATLVANAGKVHQQLNTLTEQASTGMVADTYAGLGAGASVSLNLNPKIAALNTYQRNIDQAIGSMQVTQSAMTGIQQIAATFTANMPNLNSIAPSEVDNIAANARAALQQVANLLDSKDGGTYVFGGQDSGNPPVPNPDDILSSSFYTQINAAVTSLTTSGASATIAATLAVATSNAADTSPFSAYMSQPASSIAVPVVRTGQGNATVPIGLLASGNSAVASTGASSTGSYMRDLMRSLATLGSMSSSQVNDPNFTALVQDTTTALNGSVTAMAIDVGVLGDAQSKLTATQTQLSHTATALTNQVSSVQDADMAAVLSKLTSMQTQLQESYRLITMSNSLSLINFMPAA